MAHEILGQRFLGRSEPGWHQMGETFAKELQITASEAMEKVAGDIEVISTPLFTYLDGQYHKTDNNAIVRKPTQDDPQHRVFGVVTDKWNQVDYVGLARRLDGVTSDYRVETAGILKNGSLAFLSFRGPDFDVRNDQMNDNYIVNLSNTPGIAHRAFAAKTRVVCYNTNTEALRTASINLSIPHSDDQEARLAFTMDLVAKFRTMTATSKATFERFADVQITEENLHLLFEAAYPDPTMPADVRLYKGTESVLDANVIREAMGTNFEKMLKVEKNWQRGCERAKALRSCAVERFEAFDPSHLKGTVWAAYNAVTEVSDWRESYGKEIGASILFGNRAKEKEAAYTHSLELVK